MELTHEGFAKAIHEDLSWRTIHRFLIFLKKERKICVKRRRRKLLITMLDPAVLGVLFGGGVRGGCHIRCQVWNTKMCQIWNGSKSKENKPVTKPPKENVSDLKTPPVSYIVSDHVSDHDSTSPLNMDTYEPPEKERKQRGYNPPISPLKMEEEDWKRKLKINKIQDEEIDPEIKAEVEREHQEFLKQRERFKKE